MEHDESFFKTSASARPAKATSVRYMDSESLIVEETKFQGFESTPTPPDSQIDFESYARKRNQIVIIMIAMSQGFTTFAGLSINFFFKDDLDLDPAQLSFFNSIINFVWILKPVFGFICDSYPILGSQRKSYLLIFSTIQTLCWIWLGSQVNTLGQAILIKTMINVSASFIDVIGEAFMVQASQIQDDGLNGDRRGSSGSQGDVQYDNKSTATNLSIFLSLISFSSLLSQYLGGHLLNYISTRQIFLITSLFPIITLISGFIAVEPPKEGEPLALSKLKRQQKCQLAMKNFGKVTDLLRLPFVYKPIIFIFIVVLSPGVNDAMFYYESNVLLFSTTQFAYINMLSSLAIIAGVWAYRFLFKDTPFKTMMVFSTILFGLCQLSKMLVVLTGADAELLCVQYLNLSPIHYYYITSWLYAFINQLHLMPLMVLACKMCPKNCEASFYALVMAIINLGYLLSYQLGGVLTFALGITAETFTNLWILILIATCVPLVTLFFLVAVPSSSNVNEQIEEYLSKQKPESKCQDSLDSLLLYKDTSIYEENRLDECLLSK